MVYAFSFSAYVNLGGKFAKHKRIYGEEKGYRKTAQH